mmetsp:Transcript_72792/g.210789  ORF Transcript_72792/g.210789 Transcript_72792/m.210789 type:complete len:223 (+) Transcript_72792:382-1050(+)
MVHRPNDGGSEGEGGGEVWQGRGARAGRGRAGHMVFLGVVPLLRVRLAGRGKQRRLRGLFPDDPPRDRARHLVLLGSAHGDDVDWPLGEIAVPHRLPSRHGARRAWPQDVQKLGQCDRPPRGHRRHHTRRASPASGTRQLAGEGGGKGEEGPGRGLSGRHSRVWRRRLALRLVGLHGAGPQCQPRHQPRGGLSALLQQGVERHSLRPPLLRGRLQVSWVDPP